MDKIPAYPLDQVTLIKQKKLDEAERLLREKKQLLAKEQEKLLVVERERDEVKRHRMDKLSQLRGQMDEGVSSTKIQQSRAYLKVVDEKLRIKEGRVVEQKKVVRAAEEQVEAARIDLLKKQQDVEKMALHKKEWQKEQKREAGKKESLETDELGAMLHQRLERERKKK